ncbi:hypothetical protein EWM64_g4441 [Hericium alpestre]|uniref:DUF6589 domain-containing protein n=1 Tax=Hericium alpestre TaxID=135208 RepID=A0A4Z0A056_9AGAM|nr:hypothetical protein EWM64_g4441 [Hericium alpestre]
MPRIPLSPQKNITNTSATTSHVTRNTTATPVPILGCDVSQTSTSDELLTLWHNALDSPLFPTICEILAAAAHGEISLETRTCTEATPPKQGPTPPASDSTKSQLPAEDVEKVTRVYRRVSDKLDLIGKALKEVDWSLGRNTHHAIDIVDAWFKHSYGRPKGEEKDMMYSTDMPAKDIKGARATISSFAAQLVEKQLVREMENVIKPSSGLHVITQSKTGKHALDWERLGPELFDNVATILQEHQPLAWHLLIQMASRRPRVHEGEVLIREQHPVEPIIMDVLSCIAYSRSNRAKLLPMAHGMHHFASGAHSSLYRINSRLATMPAYSTIRGALVDMAKKEAAHVRELGKSEKAWFWLVTDNVQWFSKRWEPSMTQQSQMLKGMAATAIKVDDIDPKAWDLDDKLARLAKNERLDVTVHWFLSQVDNCHLEDVKVLQWIQTLVRYVPALSKYRKHINTLYHTRVWKTAPETVTKTEVYPLTPMEKDEGVTAELKEAFVEFLEQIGQTEDSYLRRIIIAGGDGMTYEKLLQIKKYLQFHGDNFQSLAILEPLLELWHMQWTELCQIFQTHWHEDMSKDPSSLGHSASKIGWKPPSNLAKVDYYPGTRMAYTVLDACLLDCWREAAYAMAVGDAGHVYECLKLWLFTFAGSNHSKYTTYLMELIASLELESSPSLCAAIFRTWLVNPSGRPGHYLEADLLQEHFNKVLEELVQQKDIGFDDSFLTTVAARNMHHLQELPNTMEEGLGLKRCSDEHSSPANRAEIITLLRVYHEVELHYWRHGRTYGERDLDNHTRGLNALLGGRVDKWKTETTTDRGLTNQMSRPEEVPNVEHSDDEEDDEEEDWPLTRGQKYVVDGELCIDIDDMAQSSVDIDSALG